jgi:membrane-associated protease RseP (regulator of RpoE activity)
MEQADDKKRIEELSAVLSDLFRLNAVYRQDENMIFSLEYMYEREQSEKLLRDRLKTAGYKFRLHEQNGTLLLSVNPERKEHIPLINIALFLATLFTVYVVPVFHKQLAITETFGEALKSTIEALAAGAGLQFTLALISILFVHEMGHFIAGRRRQIVTSWPYFIPAPTLFGTLGAIITIKSPFWNRRDLIEVGAAGPIAGWIVAIAWLVYGLGHSSAVPLEALAKSGEMFFSLEGESVLMRLATLAIVGEAPEGQFYHLSEAAFAGWVGLLVTAINLLPIGQLDGGHILYGLFRSKQRVMGLVALVILFVLGFQSPMWWLMAGLGLVFGVNHPPTLDDERPISKTAFWMAIISILIMILSFTPVPFR